MAPRMAAVLQAPGKLCSFSQVLFVFLLFYVLDVVSITAYDRDTLLNIGSSVAQRKPDFEFLNASSVLPSVRTNRTLHYRTVLITWTGTCSGQRLMTT